jgi:uncharacterized protein YfiM (DUF2279 family)
MKLSPQLTSVAVAIAASCAFNVAVAQTPAKAPAMTSSAAAPARDTMSYSDRERMKPWQDEKGRLEQSLKVGDSKESYMKAIAAQGYTITSINADKPDYLEYEVVKDANSYEVQIDLDKNTHMGSKVEVATNMWRTDATKQAMRTGKATAATKTNADGTMYSDRANSKNWSGEKEKLEQSMAPGKDLAYYTGELKKMGYQITSTNDKKKDYVELEVVKGRDSYEVQIDMDGGKAKKVDVTGNMWQTEATEKALARSKK